MIKWFIDGVEKIIWKHAYNNPLLLVDVYLLLQLNLIFAISCLHSAKFSVYELQRNNARIQLK